MSRRLAALVACVCVILPAAFGTATAAAATGPPVTYYPLAGGSSPAITLDHTTYAAGDTIDISGTGFIGTDGEGGVHVVVKPDDDALAVAGYGGADAVTPGDVSGHPTFSSGGDGSFSGWVKLPEGVAASGPGVGEHAGEHWLRFLAGTYGNPMPAASFQAYFGIEPKVSATLRNPSLEAGGTLEFEFTGYLQAAGGGQHVGLKLDDEKIIGCALAGDDGSGSGSVSLPTDLAPGAHTLRFLGGTACRSIGEGGSETEPPAHTFLTTFTITAGAGGNDGSGSGGNDGSGPGGNDGSGPGPAPAPTTPSPSVGFAKATTLSVKRGSFVLRLTGKGAAGTAKVSVTSAGKVRVRPGKGKAKVVAVAKGRSVSLAVGRTRAVKLALTGSGKVLLARLGSLRVRVRVVEGGRVATRVLTLKPARPPAAKARQAAKAAATTALRAPDNAEGARVALASSGVTAGAPLEFSGSGFVAEKGGGQVVTVKLDDTKVVGVFEADGAGNVSGTVAAPTEAGPYWLRFLAGSGGPSGQGGGGQPPARSLTADFTVAASAPPSEGGAGGGGEAPASTPTPTPTPTLALRSLTERGGRLAVRLRCAGAPCAGTVRIGTAGRVKLGGARRQATLASGSFSLKAAATRVLKPRLTGAGRSLLAADRKLAARLTVTVKGGATLSKTLVLHRG